MLTALLSTKDVPSTNFDMRATFTLPRLSRTINLKKLETEQK